MKFSKKDLTEFIQCAGPEDWEEVETTFFDHKRWALVYRLVFSYQGKFYATEYEIPATEEQELDPFPYDGSSVECSEVIPVQKTITVYEKA